MSEIPRITGDETIYPFSKVWFLLQADQLYSLARFAYFACMMDATFRNAHHALEYYLKASLADHIPLSDLKRLGHNLSALYEAFLENYSAGPVRMEVMRYIDRYDKMRYPIQSGFYRILWGYPLDDFFNEFDRRLRKRVACFSIKDLDHMVFEIRERVVSLSEPGIIAVTADHQYVLYRDNSFFRPPPDKSKPD